MSNYKWMKRFRDFISIVVNYYKVVKHLLTLKTIYTVKFFGGWYYLQLV